MFSVKCQEVIVGKTGKRVSFGETWLKIVCDTEEIVIVNNAVVSTNGSGVPSVSTSLPSGLTASQFNLAEGTITASVKSLNVTQTWNNSGVSFDAPLFINVTNTAAQSPSYLADFQLGGHRYLVSKPTMRLSLV
jgi:hypothetical protein